MQDTLDLIFDANGIMKHCKDDYIPRASQIEAAHIISASLGDKSHAIIEGPCGFGKTFAYLVPIFEHIYEAKKSDSSDKYRTVIVTNGISLQEQLLLKDIPMVQNIFYRIYNTKLACALLKGRQNFLCNSKLAELMLKRGLTAEENNIIKWNKQTSTGDFSELSFVPEYELLGRIACTEEGECLGKSCPVYQDCYYQLHKAKALASDIVVTNYHFLFSDLKLQTASGISLLPQYGILVFDEAHEIANIYRDFMESRFGVSSIRYIKKKIKEIRNQSNFADAVFSEGFKYDPLFDSVDSFTEDKRASYPYLQISDRLIDSVSSFLGAVGENLFEQNKWSQIVLVDEKIQLPSNIRDVVADLRNLKGVLYDVSGKVSDIIDRNRDDNTDLQKIKTGLSPIISRIEEHLWLFDFLINVKVSTSDVMWFEKAEERNSDSFSERISLKQKPVLVAEGLFHNFFNKDDLTCILTSATLSVDGGYTYIKNEVGLSLCSNPVSGRSISEYIGTSPFNLAEQELWYLPSEAVSGSLDNNYKGPNQFASVLPGIVNELVWACGGGILCLATSIKNMKICYDAIIEATKKHNLRVKVFKQGDLPKQKLIQEFQNDTDSILVATKSFFTGIDIPGDSLRCVIIDKLPFPNQSDPVIMKLNEDKSSFYKHQIPMMVIALKQAVGRGVRSISDKCVIAILDDRLSTASYKDSVFRSFPHKMTGTRNIGDVDEFMSKR